MVDGEIEEPVGRGRGITEVDVERGGCTQGVKFIILLHYMPLFFM